MASEQKEKYFEDQFDDEEVLFVFRKHPIVMRVGIVLAAIGMLVGPLYTLVLTYVKTDNPPTVNFFFASIAASFLLSAILFFPSWLAWYYSVFIVTDQRFIQITQKGFFHRSVVDIGLSQIQMVNYEIAGFQETLLGFGTIMMQTYLGDLVIHDVHHPAKIQKKLFGILREQGVISSMPPAKLNQQADEDT
jgi:uncharacterized integral membrane protein